MPRPISSKSTRLKYPDKRMAQSLKALSLIMFWKRVADWIKVIQFEALPDDKWMHNKFNLIHKYSSAFYTTAKCCLQLKKAMNRSWVREMRWSRIKEKFEQPARMASRNLNFHKLSSTYFFSFRFHQLSLVLRKILLLYRADDAAASEWLIIAVNHKQTNFFFCATRRRLSCDDKLLPASNGKKLMYF